MSLWYCRGYAVYAHQGMKRQWCVFSCTLIVEGSIELSGCRVLDGQHRPCSVTSCHTASSLHALTGQHYDQRNRQRPSLQTYPQLTCFQSEHSFNGIRRIKLLAFLKKTFSTLGGQRPNRTAMSASSSATLRACSWADCRKVHRHSGFIVLQIADLGTCFEHLKRCNCSSPTQQGLSAESARHTSLCSNLLLGWLHELGLRKCFL